MCCRCVANNNPHKQAHNVSCCIVLCMLPLWKACQPNWQKGSVPLCTFLPPKQTDTVAGSQKQAAPLLPPPRPVWRQRSHASVLSHKAHSHINQPLYLLPPLDLTGLLSVCHIFFRQDTCLSNSERLASADKPDKPADNFWFCPGNPSATNWVNYRRLKWIIKLPFKAHWLYCNVSRAE